MELLIMLGSFLHSYGPDVQATCSPKTRRQLFNKESKMFKHMSKVLSVCYKWCTKTTVLGGHVFKG